MPPHVRRLTKNSYIICGLSKPLGHISVASLIIGNYFIQRKVEVLVPQSCPTLCDPMDCSPPGSSVHGLLQARILEWVAIPFSSGSSHPKDQTQVSHIAGRFFTSEPPGKPRWPTGTLKDALTTIIQHSFGSPSYSNQRRKRSKK